MGLDTDPKKMPQCVFDLHDPVFEFNKAIIDATAPYCVAYKPNLAFYEAYGLKGMESFVKTINYLKTQHPHHLIIADAKRGDIGNTSKLYARTFFEEYDVDALTVAPYMGEDSVTPFLEYEGKWVILLALTSNKGSEDFQLTPLHTPLVGRWGPGSFKGERLFEKVLKTSQQWGTDENMMGAQGGSLEEVCKYGMTDDCGLLVNSSRAIIFASQDDHFAEIAGNKARELQQQMDVLLKSRNL